MANEVLNDIVAQLLAIVEQIKSSMPTPQTSDPTIPGLLPEEPTSRLDLAAFFAAVRKPLFDGRLTAGQVQGMEAKLLAFQEAEWPISWAAYALATSYHETARRMLPVREGLSASETWRKKNLRYYPYYGRGDVQLTWKENYERADRELGLGGALTNNLDLALDPVISARVMVRGMDEGWFAGDKAGRHTLARHLPNEQGTKVQFIACRRIINGTDKAAMIAQYALDFQEALRKAGW